MASLYWISPWSNVPAQVYVITTLALVTHWGRVTHICVSKLTIIGSDNGLLPGQHQAIIWRDAGILLTEPLRTSCIEIVIEIYTFSFKKMHWKCCLEKGGHFISASMCYQLFRWWCWYIQEELGQYYGCCSDPIFLHCQGDCVRWVYACLSWGKISTTCDIWEMLQNSNIL